MVITLWLHSFFGRGRSSTVRRYSLEGAMNYIAPIHRHHPICLHSFFGRGRSSTVRRYSVEGAMNYIAPIQWHHPICLHVVLWKEPLLHGA